MRPPAGDSAKARANGFHRHVEEINCRGTQHQRHNRSGNAHGKPPADDQHQHGEHCECGGFVGESAEVCRQCFYSQPEHAGNFVEMKPEEILDLSASDQYRDAVGETDHNRTGNKLDRCAQSRDAHNDKQHTCHDRAHKQAIHAMNSNDARHHDHERSGRPANLRLRSAQCGDKESRDDGAIDARLRSKSRGNSERHGQRQRDQTDRHSRDQIKQKLVAIVIAQAQNGFRQPALAKESNFHVRIMRPAPSQQE